MRPYTFERLVPIIAAAICVAVMSIPAWVEAPRDQCAALTAR
jgi:hypothetical protein